LARGIVDIISSTLCVSYSSAFVQIMVVKLGHVLCIFQPILRIVYRKIHEQKNMA